MAVFNIYSIMLGLENFMLKGLFSIWVEYNNNFLSNLCNTIIWFLLLSKLFKPKLKL